MQSTSKGKVPRYAKKVKTKGGTATTRKHHFESFSNRIAKLKIDPVHRSRRLHFDEEDLSARTSHFRTSLQEWEERNLSENFGLFVSEINRLADSLPSILHHEDRIIEVLVTYLDKQDALSLEPLLDLTRHLAHDLGRRFHEKHFAKVFKSVTGIAANHADIEAIEWAFNCLAWLFKYLSKLLVYDMETLFDLVAPLLGKTKQKYFVTRFAAEALSSLLQKAALLYHKDPAPLNGIVRHIAEDIERVKLNQCGDVSQQYYQYQQGLMALYSRAMKGVQGGIHSTATAIMECLLTQTSELVAQKESSQTSTASEELLDGVLISLLHHVDGSSFQPLMAIVLKNVCPSDAKNEMELTFYTHLLFIVCGTNKGKGVSNWNDTLVKICQLISYVESSGATISPSTLRDILYAVAITFQYAPLQLLTQHRRILQIFEENRSSPTSSNGSKDNTWAHFFLPFCSLFAELDSQRFRGFLLPYLQRSGYLLFLSTPTRLT
jgi:U3 small nucleolar RNA-associated protein 20